MVSWERELGGPVDDFYSHVEQEALATASIAQVHRARTRDGDEVVLKIRKRGIEKLIEQDVHVLELLAEFLADWPDFRLFDPKGIVRLFERSIQRELNFDLERNHLRRMRENVGEDGDVYIPKVYPEYCRSGLLNIEYLAGRRLTSLREEPLSPEEGARRATQISICMLTQVFENGLYHADPHPGNFILMDDGRIGLIDFGSVGTCTPQLVDQLLLLLVALIRRDYPEIARWLMKRAGPTGELEGELLALELMDTLDAHYGLGIGDIRIGDLFNSLFSIVRQQGVSIPAPYVHVGRTFVILEGVVRLCSPELELVPAIQPYMNGVLRRRWSPERLLRDLRADASEILTAFRSYPSNLAEVFARAASGRFHVETSLSGLKKVEGRLEQASRRIPLAILVCGLLISSSIVLFSQAEADTNLQTILGAAGFVGGLLLAARLALRG